MTRVAAAAAVFQAYRSCVTHARRRVSARSECLNAYAGILQVDQKSPRQMSGFNDPSVTSARESVSCHGD
jgi:hypothetical protein